MDAEYFVEARGISKRFFAVQALQDIHVAVKSGDIHALVGENGAGKSTLGKIISGVIRPDSGQLIVEGRVVHYAAPRDALHDGITTITQEISLLSKQTVLDNVLLGQEYSRAGVLNRNRMIQRFNEVRELTGFDLAPDVKVNTLRMADQKKVEVMQAVARNARLIIMDEPTAMLSDEDTATFLEIVRQLKAMGRTIIYVSHFLKEVLNLADMVTIMRNGEIVRTSPTVDETPDTLITAMLGKSMAQMYPPKQFPPDDAPIALSVTGLRSSVFRGIDLEVRAGEIAGLAGLVGSGRSRLARTLFGAEEITGGKIFVSGEQVHIHSTQDAIKAGIYMLPESRKEQGLLLRQTVRHNITLPHLRDITSLFGIIRGQRELSRIDELVAALNIQPPVPSNKVNTLSGGNQQKTLFGKWLFDQPKLFIVDEPTRGIDVGAKQAIYELIVELAKQGMGILMISSEIEEILGLAHRVLVMRLGEIVAELPGDETLTEDKVMRAAFGTHEAQDVPETEAMER
ncbi:MAG: sugar ABC transporter ATP-binding protein [Chloroflexi bacterium]|nr:MAG: ABC transporter [Phototrophicales bacterium]RMF78367.1 MAG: sugar ABC transporter ATP-binding protein [Chloroflexota bacterium]